MYATLPVFLCLSLYFLFHVVVAAAAATAAFTPASCWCGRDSCRRQTSCFLPWARLSLYAESKYCFRPWWNTTFLATGHQSVAGIEFTISGWANSMQSGENFFSRTRESFLSTIVAISTTKYLDISALSVKSLLPGINAPSPDDSDIFILATCLPLAPAEDKHMLGLVYSRMASVFLAIHFDASHYSATCFLRKIRHMEGQNCSINVACFIPRTNA